MIPPDINLLRVEPLARLVVLSLVLMSIGSLAAWILRRYSADLLRTIWAALLIGQLCAAPVCFLSSGFRWLPDYAAVAALPSRKAIPVEGIVPPVNPNLIETTEASPGGTIGSQAAGPEIASATVSWRQSLYICWSAGILLLLLRVGVGLVLCFYRLRAGADTVTAPGLLASRRSSRIRVTLCKGITSPFAWGVFFPRIVISSNALGWSRKQRRFVLLHEMVHIQRNDGVVLLLAHCSRAVFWFNPLVWFGCHQLRSAIEYSCDDEVVRGSRAAAEYAEALLATARGAVHAAPSFVLGMADGPLLIRVRQILDPLRTRTRPSPLLGRMTTGLVVLIAGGLAISRPSAQFAGAEDTTNSPVQLIRDRNGQTLFNRALHDPYRFDSTAAHLLYDLSRRENPAPDMQLTIDIQRQQGLEKALKQIARGSAVLLDPNTGDILALASVPTFSPGKVIEQWEALNADPLTPLMNRAVNSSTPGAAFLPVTALAGGLKGKGNTRFVCTGGVTYGDKFMSCCDHAGHGKLGLEDALQHSCNSFFYQYGNACGIDAIVRMGDALGLGRSNHLLTGESQGILPSPEWLRRIRPDERWSGGNTASVAIGQGAVDVTPLQMATVAGALGTRGLVFEPRLYLNRPARLRANLAHLGLDSNVMDKVRTSMWKTMNGSSSGNSMPGSSGVQIAGQMGLGVLLREQADGNRAQEVDAWFIGFAPYQNPRFAIAVCIEGDKSEGRDCAAIATEVLHEALGVRVASSSQQGVTQKPSAEPYSKLNVEGIKMRQVPVRLIATNTEEAPNTVRIDRGSNAGIEPDMPMLTRDGVVGKVAKVEQTTATVLLITDESCKVAARVSGTQMEGIVKGMSTSSGGTPLLGLHFLPKSANLKSGQKIYTSGVGGVFPKGLLIGSVSEFQIRELDGFAKVVPAADLGRLKDLFVLVHEE